MIAPAALHLLDLVAPTVEDRPSAHVVDVRHRLDLALPEKVVMARPTGVGRADAINIRIPIEGAEEWLTMSRESA